MKSKKIILLSLLLIAILSIPIAFAEDIANDCQISSSDGDNNLELEDVSFNENDCLELADDSMEYTESDWIEEDSNSQIISQSGSNVLKSGVTDPIYPAQLDTDFTNLDVNLTNNNTIFVNSSYTGSGESGTKENPYKTINLAFKTLLSNYNKKNIFIANGFYETSSYISISRSINIIGEDSLNTIISGKNSSAIFIIKNPSTVINIFNLTFTMGNDYYGGAIYLNHSSVNIVNTIFKDNIGHDFSSSYANYCGMGGALYSESGILKIYNCSFINNTVYGEEDVYGGAIYNYLGDLIIINSQFENNSLKGKYGSGGAIYNYGGFFTFFNSSVSNSTINSNYSLGGAITNWNARNVYVLNSTISGNVLEGNYTIGSAIASKANFLYVENSTIKDNLANGTGFLDETIYIIDGIFNESNNVYENNGLLNSIENLLMCLEEQSTHTIYFDADSLVNLPSRYDLREEGLVTPIKDQGSSGSCWAFATLGALESYLLKFENISYDLSENNLKNLMSYYSINGTDWDDGGNYLMALAYLLRWSGPVDESLDPFSDSSHRSPYDLELSKHIQDVLYIPVRLGFTDNDQIKAAILKYGALFTTVYSSSYMNYHTNYYTERPELSNHAVVIVGWDDNFSRTNFGTDAPPGDGAFIMRNSWGESLGDKGYWYVSYYDNGFAGFGLDTISAMAFVGVENLTDYKSVYQYDILGNTYESIGYNCNTAWFANQFTANSNNPLSAFGLYTFGDSDYFVNITVNGVSKYTGSGLIKGAGFHTIKLNEYVSLETNDIFRVIIKLTTYGSKFPIAIESQRKGYTSQATASLSESFVSPDGENWYDIAKTTELPKFYEALDGDHQLNKTNVCLKAYTAYAGNLVLNSTANVSLYIKGDTIELLYNLSNIGDYISDINISLVLDDAIDLSQVLEISKGNFDMSTKTWYLDNMDAGESQWLKVILSMVENKEITKSYALLNTSGFNIGNKGYITDLDDEEAKEANALSFYYSGFTQFLEIGSITSFAKSNDEINITLVDILNRTLSDKQINVSRFNGEIEEFSQTYQTNDLGIATIRLDLLEGNYTYIVRFNGDSQFDSSNMTFNLSVMRKATSFVDSNLKSLSILSKSGEEIKFYLIDELSGRVERRFINLTVGNIDGLFEESHVLELNEKGFASFKFNLTKGTYNLTLSFEGDELYLPATYDFNMDVKKRDAPLVLAGDAVIDYGEDYTICLVDSQFNFLVNKLVNLSLLDSKGESFNRELLTDENGLLNLNGLNAGTYTISGIFANDEEYEDVSFSNIRLVVLAKPTSIQANDMVKYFGDSQALAVKLLDGNNAAIANKELEISINNIPYKFSTDAYGLINVNLNDILSSMNLFEGIHEVKISFSEADNYAASSKSINLNLVKPIISLSKLSLQANSNLIVSFSDYNGNPLDNTLVYYTINGKTASKMIVNGRISIPMNYNPSKYDIAFRFEDAGKLGSLLQTKSVELTRIPTKITAKKKTFKLKAKVKKYTVTLKDNKKKAIKKAKLTLKIKGKSYRATTNAKGKAIFKIKKFNKKGRFTATVRFAATKLYKASSKKVKLTFKK